MAKLYGNIASSALMTFDKSFARANGQPLDSSEVYYSLAAAKEYAAGAGAYIGQKIVVIENGVVTHYSVEDAAGTLKELGAKPVADGTTIAIGSDGKITLANITDAEASGTYNAVLVNGKLTWVKPSETTVEGLSDLINALTGRVETAEGEIDTLQEAVGVASKPESTEGAGDAVVATGLYKAVEDEAKRAEAAEKALGDRIDAIDFIDETELNNAISAARSEISTEIDNDVKVAKDRADEAYALAETKVDSTTYATDKKALEDEDAAIRAIAEDAQNTINNFLTSEEVDATVNTLKEIKAEIDKMTDATELATALSAKADVSYVNEELAKKQDVIPENTYDAYGSAATAKSEAIADAEGKIATAKQEAIDAAASAAAGIYATQTALSNLETSVDGRLDTLEAINHEVYATKEELEAHKTEASGAYATKDELKATDDVAKDAQNRVDIVEGKIDEITSVGGEPNVLEKIKVNGVTLEIEKDDEGKSTKSVNIAVPTKFSDITDDSGFDARINAAQSKAEEGVSAASAAAAAAATAQGEVDSLETVVGNLTTVVTGHTTTISDHGTRIGALEQADVAHATEYNTLSGIVTGHTQTIATLATKEEHNALAATVGGHTSAINTLNDTTIPALKTELENQIKAKANSADVYTKVEIGTIAEGKTIVKMIEDAQSAATYDDTSIKALIKANSDAIDVLNGSVETEGSVLKIATKAASDAVATVVGAAPEAMDTLEEVANWIANDESGAAAMIKRIGDNEKAIAAINDEATGILALANDYTDTAINGLPKASAEAFGLAKVDNVTIKAEEGVISVKEISTDLLVQGTEELILCGGTASK